MARELVRVFALVFLLLAGGAGIYLYYGHLSTERALRDEQEKNRVLREVIGRLTAERRVAEMLVTDQQVVGGVKTTTVLFVEYSRDGKATLPPRTFVVRGENAHLDAMVVKFDPELVGQGDPLRGATIALFTRMYGDATAPEQGTPIDVPGEIPAAYAGADPKVSAFEMELWKDFWKLAHDETARKTRGVRAVVGQGLWEPLKPETLYTVTLEAAGGLSLTREPVKGVFRQAMRQAGGTPTRER